MKLNHRNLLRKILEDLELLVDALALTDDDEDVTVEVAKAANILAGLEMRLEP